MRAGRLSSALSTEPRGQSALSKALVVSAQLGLVLGTDRERLPSGPGGRAVGPSLEELDAMGSVVARTPVLGQGIADDRPEREVVRPAHLAQRALEKVAHEALR